MKKSKNVIIDTDIGSDVDDALALVYALKSPELDIKAVTTVHGDTKLRGKIAKKLCQLARPDAEIPVIAGYEKPIESNEVFWMGDEGKGLDIGGVNIDGCNVEDSLRDIIYKNLETDLICLAPYTNIARLFQKYSDVKECIGRIYLMNRVSGNGETFVLDHESHNTKADPKAAEVIFESGVPITLITTELSKQTYLTMDDFKCLRKSGALWSEMVYQNAKNWLKFSRYDVSYLYDPLTIAVAEDSSIVSTRKTGNLEIATELNVDFKEQFLNRIMNGVT